MTTAILITDPGMESALHCFDARLTAVTLADITLEDAPLVCVNEAFVNMTGYARDEVLGHNCRFLQGEGPDQNTLCRIRNHVLDQTSGAFCLLNYCQDGTPFQNLLLLSPLTGTEGRRFSLG